MWPYLLESFVHENNLLSLGKYFNYLLPTVLIKTKKNSWFNINILIPTLIIHFLYETLTKTPFCRHVGLPVNSASYENQRLHLISRIRNAAEMGSACWFSNCFKLFAFFFFPRTVPDGWMNSVGCGVPQEGFYSGEYHTWYHSLLPLGGFTGWRKAWRSHKGSSAYLTLLLAWLMVCFLKKESRKTGKHHILTPRDTVLSHLQHHPQICAFSLAASWQTSPNIQCISGLWVSHAPAVETTRVSSDFFFPLIFQANVCELGVRTLILNKIEFVLYPNLRSFTNTILHIRSVYIPAQRNKGILFLSPQTLPFFSETISREEREQDFFLHVK